MDSGSVLEFHKSHNDVIGFSHLWLIATSVRVMRGCVLVLQGGPGIRGARGDRGEQGLVVQYTPH